MTASLIPTPVMQFLDADGNPLVGGKVYTYAAGTSTPLATYTDYGGGTPNANPVILNSRGEASIWFGTAAYKLELYTAATVLIWTADNVSASTPVVYGTGVAAALAINVGTAGSILVNGGALVGTTLGVTGAATLSSTLGVSNGATGMAVTLNSLSSGNQVSSGTTQTYGSLRVGSSGSTGVIDFGIAGSTNWIQSTDRTALGSLYTLALNPNGGAVTCGGTLGVTGAFTGTTGAFNNGTTGITLGAGLNSEAASVGSIGLDSGATALKIRMNSGGYYFPFTLTNAGTFTFSNNANANNVVINSTGLSVSSTVQIGTVSTLAQSGNSIYASRNFEFNLTYSPAITNNKDIGFAYVDNTHLRVYMKGSDGVTRSVDLTVA